MRDKNKPSLINIVKHEGEVTRAERYLNIGQKGATLWLTGLSGSGKSTLAYTLEKMLLDRGKKSYVLDGDNIRLGLNVDLGFSAECRAENIRRVGEVSKLFSDAGLIVLSSFISPFSSDRDKVRNIHASAGLSFVEIFLSTPLDVCEKRDVKKLYSKAKKGKIKNFTGISSPYEAPVNPDITILDGVSSKDSAQIIIDYLLEKQILE